MKSSKYTYLPNTDDSVSDQNEKNDERLNKCGDRVLVFLKKGQDKGDNGGKQENFD